MPHRLIFIILFALAVTARSAEISPFNVRVEQAANTDTDKFKKTQEKKLKIFVTNNSSADANLTVKYFFFGHGAKDHESATLDKGDKAASVKSHTTELVETPKATATFNEAHYEKKGGKKIEASGNKLTGYGVQVLNGGTVVAEYFSEPSLKASLEGSR